VIVGATLNLPAVLAAIRREALAIAAGGWATLGELVDTLLPDPLDPMALLPIATGLAGGGALETLIPVAAAIVLVDAALRIADDCADRDDPNALYQAIGVGRAINASLALTTLATRALAQATIPSQRAGALMATYFEAFIAVCQGQDRDQQPGTGTLKDYQALVEHKTVAAYQFAALAGALTASDDAATLERCAACGAHLGWMAQILDDIESLWFPIDPTTISSPYLTFPTLLGLSRASPQIDALRALLDDPAPSRAALCATLDAMHIRPQLMEAALDHRDQARPP